MFRSLLISVILLCLSTSLAGSTVLGGNSNHRQPPQPAQSSGRKILTRQSRFSNEPVQVMDVEVQGQRVKLRGKPASFDQSSDWLRGFVVRFKNVSDKPISAVEFHLALAEPKTSANLITFTLKYGGASPGADSRQLLMPGATAQLALSAAWYDEANLSMQGAGNSPLTVVDTADLKLSYVYFADETAWHEGSLVRQ